mmetsp:Transcript_113322/g.331228  ORF Transcript_113322/g.331228 Transcript_113322/m.331228 type:complete len:217 (+) Transcript_113322:719-1369(+)
MTAHWSMCWPKREERSPRASGKHLSQAASSAWTRRRRPQSCLSSGCLGCKERSSLSWRRRKASPAAAPVRRSTSATLSPCGRGRRASCCRTCRSGRPSGITGCPAAPMKSSSPSRNLSTARMSRAVSGLPASGPLSRRCTERGRPWTRRRVMSTARASRRSWSCRRWRGACRRCLPRVPGHFQATAPTKPKVPLARVPQAKAPKAKAANGPGRPPE